MTLRQLWIRYQALPYDSPLDRALGVARTEADAARKATEVDDALTRYRPKEG